MPPLGWWQRPMRLKARFHPSKKPYFFNDKIQYSEQLGSKRQALRKRFGAIKR